MVPVEKTREYQLEWKTLSSMDIIIIDVCGQSPFIIQFQNASLYCSQLVDGTNFDLHSQVLGYGKALGMLSCKPVQDHPGQFCLVDRVVYIFFSMHATS